MRLSRIYVDAKLDIDVSIDLPVATNHYILHVLRLKNSQQIILFNGRENIDYLSKIEISNKKLSVVPFTRTENNIESTLQTSLYQALGKPEHIDLIVQKATELGISEIHLFNSQRTQAHQKGARLEKKMKHWQGIVISACEQCGRNSLPTIRYQQSLESCLALASESNKLLLDFNGASFSELSSRLDADISFSMLVGAEGGFTEDEIKIAKNSGFSPCILGPRTLRMETAAISILSIIQHHFGDMP